MTDVRDLYTRAGDSLDFERTGRTVSAGGRLPEGTYRAAVQAWIRSDINQYLIIRPSAEQGGSLCWGPLGGSVAAGETGEAAAIRRAKEALGLSLPPGAGKRIGRGVCGSEFADAWLFEQDYKTIDRSLRLWTEEIGAAVQIFPEAIHFLRELGLWTPWPERDFAERIIGRPKPFAEMTEAEYRETIEAYDSAARSFGAAGEFDLELTFQQKAYDMTREGLQRWPVKNRDERDCRMGDAAVDLAYSLINLKRYAEAEERVSEGLALLEGVFARGEEKTVIWRLHDAHFCKRRILIRTGRKREVAVEREIIKQIKEGTYSIR